jgi:hypothetical protein
MKQFMVAAVALLTATAAQAHQWTPTYPQFEKSYVENVVVTTMKLFNKRQDVSFYEIGVYDENWNPIVFATPSKIIEVGYLEKKNIDIYILEKDCNRIEYICTTSKILADEKGNGINSRICSKV